MAKIQIKEIIWEITSRCSNNCTYCGSSAVTSNDLEETSIIAIAESIIKSKPDKVNISGGDPSLMFPKGLRKVVELLQAADIEVTILMNPKSLYGLGNKFDYAIFDWLGLSINTCEELNYAVKYLNKLSTAARQEFIAKVTVITNFNKTNYLLAPAIAAFIKNNVTTKCWQVQYTMYKAASFDALYEEHAKDERRELEKLLSDTTDEIEIIVADNANDGECSAGISSVGILADGSVVPCLSMRSWKEDMLPYVQGKISTKTSLQDIWEQSFKEQRFNDFFCCKNHCNKIKLIIARKAKLITSDDWWQIQDGTKLPLDTGKVMAYAVAIPGTTVYGVTNPITSPVTALYAVTVSDSSNIRCMYGVKSWSNNTGTYITDDKE